MFFVRLFSVYPPLEYRHISIVQEVPKDKTILLAIIAMVFVEVIFMYNEATIFPLEEVSG